MLVCRRIAHALGRRSRRTLYSFVQAHTHAHTHTHTYVATHTQTRRTDSHSQTRIYFETNARLYIARLLLRLCHIQIITPRSCVAYRGEEEGRQPGTASESVLYTHAFRVTMIGGPRSSWRLSWSSFPPQPHLLCCSESQEKAILSLACF